MKTKSEILKQISEYRLLAFRSKGKNIAKICYALADSLERSLKA